MKLNLTFSKTAEIMKGELVSKTPLAKVSAFVTDSRVVGAGDAFIALKGLKHDAHEFIPQVIKQGAVLVVAQKERCPQISNEAVSVIYVQDTLKALQLLAQYHRLNSTLKVAAITGSNGKSTTKQMLKAICSQAGETVANMGNFNNQFGTPFSLLEIQPKHKYGVFELGASHCGDIDELAAIAVPDVAVITNVGPSHLESFKTLENVYKTKTEIAAHLNFGGTLVYNVDDPLLARLQTEFKGEAFVLDIKLPAHDKLNAAAAAAAAIALGLHLDEIKKGLSAFTPMPMRMERVEKAGAHFILDCYNANPASMKNALEILGREPFTPRVAVLGDMKELGETSKDYHRLIARQLLDNQVDYAFLAGEQMHYAYEILNRAESSVRAVYGKTPQEWTKQLKALIKKQGGTYLIKASRSMNFENIFKEI